MQYTTDFMLLNTYTRVYLLLLSHAFLNTACAHIPALVTRSARQEGLSPEPQTHPYPPVPQGIPSLLRSFAR